MTLRHFLSVCIFVAAVHGQDTARMDQLIQSYAADNKFMGSVLVARGSDVLFSKSYGSANLEWNIPNSSTTKFRIGSITKQFTAASILLLEERGKLKIEDPVKKYMPDAPAAWDNITIHHVLTHTSGIPSFTGFPDYAQAKMFNTPVEKIVAKFRDKPLDFAPGEKFSYSNSGYVLLGYLIEKISGQTYENFLQESIFTPLGMKDSGVDSNSAIIQRRAAGYARPPKGIVNADYINMSIPHGAGAIYSTTEDLLRWKQGLFGGKLLSASSLQKMTAPFKDNYAYGIMSRAIDGRKQLWHNGGIEGFNSSLAHYPETKVTIAVLANVNGPVADQLLPQLAKLAHGEAIILTSERKEISVPKEALATYVGTYEMARGINMMITLDGNQMMGQLSGQARYPLFAEDESKFFFKIVDAQIDFVKDNKGAVTDLILHQNGRDQKARRTSDTVLVRKEIVVSPQILAAYPGSYQLGPMTLTISLESGQLMMQATGQPKLPLFSESETSFFLKVVDAQIEFVKTGDAVNALILHQGGRDMRAERK